MSTGVICFSSSICEPWKQTTQKVDQHVCEGFEIITTAQLSSQVAVNGSNSWCACQMVRDLERTSAQEIENQCIIAGLSAKPMYTGNSGSTLEPLQHMVFSFHRGFARIMEAEFEFDSIHFVVDDIKSFVYSGCKHSDIRIGLNFSHRGKQRL
ncbi:hypothetical protein BDN67DRAFT_983818 [Paxillus ammoniavirescens]|nr:hypothetical protein BDN67DRAFT_983818 [Paxillus ammoniavirescens]